MAKDADVFSWSPPQLQRHIRTVAADSRRVVFLRHVMERMVRRNISPVEVRASLRYGRLHGIPEPNLAKGSLECDMRHVCAGRELRVIVALSNDEADLILITVMSLTS